MNENLNLEEILKGCPEGTEFYSPLFVKVVFSNIDLHSTYPIRTDKTSFTSDGRYLEDFAGECMLFPSKDQRDWSKFERFWDKAKVEKFDVNTLQPFDRILVRFSGNLNWQIGLFGYKYEKLIYSNGTVYYQCVPYNEETKHLIGTTNDCPDYYKWWGE